MSHRDKAEKLPRKLRPPNKNDLVCSQWLRRGMASGPLYREEDHSAAHISAVGAVGELLPEETSPLGAQRDGDAEVLDDHGEVATDAAWQAIHTACTSLRQSLLERDGGKRWF